MSDDKPLHLGDIKIKAGNHNAFGNIGHTVNVDTRIKRTLQQEMKAGFLRDLPKDRPVQVFGLSGNTESMAFASEIHHFLKGNGYPMAQESAGWHLFFNPPAFNVNISEGNGGAEWWIVVGPAE